jgi:hypothetical protein
MGSSQLAEMPASPALIEQALFEVKRLIVGQDYTLERLLIALLAKGHRAAGRRAGPG